MHFDTGNVYIDPIHPQVNIDRHEQTRSGLAQTCQIFCSVVTRRRIKGDR